MAKLTPYDPAMLLKTDEDIVAYLTDCYQDNDPAVFILALRDIAKIKGFAALAKGTGLNRESLYRSLSGKTQPKWDTVHRIMKYLNIKLQAVA